MKMSRSGNGFGVGSRNAENKLLEVPKTLYSVETKKWFARNENEPFWQ